MDDAYFSFKQSSELLVLIGEVTGIGGRIRAGEFRLMDFVFDVMLPEVRQPVLVVPHAKPG